MGQSWQTFKTSFLVVVGAYVAWKACKHVDQNREEVKEDAGELWAKIKNVYNNEDQ